MTIKEIAKLAGVSSAAVSRYLNGGYVSDEKKEQIRKVIEETGYQPSAQARMLRTKKACLVGVVVPKINSESISRITAGVEQVFQREIIRCCLQERTIHRQKKSSICVCLRTIR
ncbi:MAG: LacI family DNA-binding transcriptional regulator [Dorea sp.]